MRHLTNKQITQYASEKGIEYRLAAHAGQYRVFIVNDRADNYELSIEEWGNTVHDSVPFPTLLDALLSAEEMIEELRTLDYDAHIAKQEARHNESVDYEEDQRRADPVRLDSVYQLLDSISEPLYLLSDFEHEFLSRLLDNPLAAEFEEHLKPDSAAAFERFKTMGLVELAAISDRWRITNAGRRALRLPSDPQID